jgi:hypothetical protein
LLASRLITVSRLTIPCAPPGLANTPRWATDRRIVSLAPAPAAFATV